LNFPRLRPKASHQLCRASLDLFLVASGGSMSTKPCCTSGAVFEHRSCQANRLIRTLEKSEGALRYRVLSSSPASKILREGLARRADQNRGPSVAGLCPVLVNLDFQALFWLVSTLDPGQRIAWLLIGVDARRESV